MICTHHFVRARIGFLANLRANPRFKLWPKSLKCLALIARTVATVRCGDRDAAWNVRKTEAVLVLVAVLTARAAARIPVEPEILLGVAEFGDSFAGHVKAKRGGRLNL